MNATAQCVIGDANETPRLHQADAASLMRGVEQPRKCFGGNRIGQKMTHIAAFGDGAINASQFLFTEPMGIHNKTTASSAAVSTNSTAAPYTSPVTPPKRTIAA